MSPYGGSQVVAAFDGQRDVMASVLRTSGRAHNLHLEKHQDVLLVENKALIDSEGHPLPGLFGGLTVKKRLNSGVERQQGLVVVTLRYITRCAQRHPSSSYVARCGIVRAGIREPSAVHMKSYSCCHHRC